MSFYFLPPTDVGEIHRPCLDMFGSSPSTAEEREQKQLSVIMDRGSAENAVTICVCEHCSQSILHTYIAYISVFFI
jgi:hypothetical protein